MAKREILDTTRKSLFMPLTTLIIDWNFQVVHPEQDYFARLVSKDWGLVPFEFNCTNDCPDFIILYHAKRRANIKDFKTIRKKWGEVPFILGITGEREDIGLGFVNYSISYRRTYDNNYFFPFFIGSNFFNAGLNPTDLGAQEFNEIKKEYLDVPKTRFCNFVYYQHRRSFPGTITREKFCRELSKYKRVDCGGRVLNNTQELKVMEKALLSSKKEHQKLGMKSFPKLDFISCYRFTIAFENYSYPYYLTEKIWDSLLTGSIPIYWGCPQVAEFFNPASFINCHDYSSWDEVIAKVKLIDNDPQAYNSYISAAPITKTSAFNEYKLNKVQDEMNKIMSLVVQHRKKVDKKRKTQILRQDINIRAYRNICRQNSKFWGIIQRIKLFIKIN